jgi:CPA2 family monovalent cation:H+ antiporter-2
LSESDYSHQALSDIIPLRDIFGMVFFVSVGMLLDPRFLIANIGTVLLLVVVFSLGKAAIFAGITRAFGYRGEVPLAVGLGLFQIGEFAFVLARVGLNDGALSSDQYGLILATTLLTMLLTPFVSRLAAPLYTFAGRWRRVPPAPVAPLPEEALHNHIIIAGYGRVGRYTSNLLKRMELPFIVIERDQYRMDELKAAGIPVVYGDASSPTVLEAVGIHHARLLLVVVSAAIDVETISRQARLLNPRLHVVARATQLSQMEVLHGLGIHEVVQPEFEAGLEMMRQALLHFDIPADEIERLSDTVRGEHYLPIAAPHADAMLLDQLRHARSTLEISWFAVPADSPLIGQTIRVSEVRQRTGASLVAVLRDGVALDTPGPETTLQAGDLVAVLGSAAQRAAFHELIEQSEGIIVHVTDVTVPTSAVT